MPFNISIKTQEIKPELLDTESEKLNSSSLVPTCQIPSQYFFVELISFENEETHQISNKETYRFFELQLETLSPIPLDQLLWGYYTPPNSNQSILYASLKSRLADEGYDSLEEYTWVIPEFIPQLALGLIQASDLHDTSKLDTYADTLTNSLHLENDFRVSVTQSNQDRSSDEVTPSTILDSQLLWSADIRSETFKDQEKKNRSRLAFVHKSLKFSLYFIAFILLSELLLSGANLWLTQYASKTETQGPTVRRIEDQHTLINKLEQISQNELRPIALLEQANLIRSMISSNIIYDNVDITKENVVTIKGTAGSVNDLNRYVSKLNQSKNFNVLEDPKYITRGGKTTFTLKMYYQSEKSSI